MAYNTFTTSPKYPGWLIMRAAEGEWWMSNAGTESTVIVRELTGGFGAWVKRKGCAEVRVWGYGGSHVNKACEEALW